MIRIKLETANRRIGETAKAWRNDFAIFVVGILFILLGCALFGCYGTRYVGTPSTTPAVAAVSAAQSANVAARSRVDRIEAKTIVIDRYWDTAK